MDPLSAANRISCRRERLNEQLLTQASGRHQSSQYDATSAGGLVQPSQSALFLMGNPRDPNEVASQFRAYGGTILRTTPLRPTAGRAQQTIGTQPPATR